MFNNSKKLATENVTHTLLYTTHSYMLKTQYNFGHQSFDFQLAETSLF